MTSSLTAVFWSPFMTQAIGATNERVNFCKIVRRSRLFPMSLTEVTYLLNKSAGQRGVGFFLQTFEASKPHLEALQAKDLRRVREILRTYPDARLDFVDCCIVAMSERLNITRVCTFDRRDFSIFRPTHCEYLELLP